MAVRGVPEQARGASVAAVPRPPAAAAEPAEPPAPAGKPAGGEARLSARPESAATAREFAVSVLRQWALSPYAETVELLVSELVGNAVRHAGARTVGLRVLWRRGWIRVEVRDPSRALPCLLPVRELDVSGRGLMLVNALSDRWGADLHPSGKTVWCELRVSER